MASLQTRAEFDGETWLVNGQKVWTSVAQYADWGLLLARTDVDVPKHKGLTMFLVDMHHPGVTVRPLKDMTGHSRFNEIFFDDVTIPDAHRLGEVNDGWGVAVTTLLHERLSISSGVGMSGQKDNPVSFEALRARLDTSDPMSATSSSSCTSAPARWPCSPSGSRRRPRQASSPAPVAARPSCCSPS